ERFSTTENRLMNVMEMQEILLNAYSEFTSEELVKKMEENDVPAAKINTREEVLNDPQVINNNSIINTSKEGKEIIRGPKPPANFMNTNCDEPGLSPSLGQHSSEILKEYGYSEDDINSLIDNQIIQGEKIG
ncbi:MAG: CoA transferase, partial [Alphaproteobacteria bacterium]